eukprot:751388-Hanusia_phi.AAC.1
MSPASRRRIFDRQEEQTTLHGCFPGRGRILGEASQSMREGEMLLACRKRCSDGHDTSASPSR